MNNKPTEGEMEVKLSICLKPGLVEIEQEIERKAKRYIFHVSHLDDWGRSIGGYEPWQTYRVIDHTLLELFWFKEHAYVLYSQNTRPEPELTPIIDLVHTVGGEKAIEAMLPM